MHRCLTGALGAVAVLVVCADVSGAFLGPLASDAGFAARLEMAGDMPIIADAADPVTGVVPGVLESFSSRTLSGNIANNHEVVSRTEVSATATALSGALHFEAITAIALTTMIETSWYANASVMLELVRPGVLELSGTVLRGGARVMEFSAGVTITPVSLEGAPIEHLIVEDALGSFAAQIPVPAGAYEVTVWADQSQSESGDSGSRNGSVLFALVVPTPGTLALLGMSGLLLFRRGR